MLNNITLNTKDQTVILFVINDNKDCLLVIGNDDIKFCKYDKLVNDGTKSNKYEHYPGDTNKHKRIYTALRINWVFLYFYLNELKVSSIYRQKTKNYLQTHCKTLNNHIICQIIPPAKDIIDYQWNERTSQMVWERCELDHTMSWLSTLGGAFSALGEEFSHCAKMAGKISFHQLGLALRLGDPMTVSRCKLYLSLSLIQRGALKLARRIILDQYNMAKNATVEDTRLIRMCQGIWSKLQYCWKLKKLPNKT